MAWSTISLAAVPWGSTLHRFMMPLYSPRLDADLQGEEEIRSCHSAGAGVDDLDPVQRPHCPRSRTSARPLRRAVFDVCV